MSRLPPLGALARSACLVLFVCFVTVASCPGQNVDENWWGTLGGVRDFLVDGTTLYVAGTFRWVGPHTGGGVPLDPGTAQRVPGFPRVRSQSHAGTVSAAVSDGAGGWYIAGGFDSVGGVPRRNAAHILADLSVGTWAPEPDLSVQTLVVDGATVYLGGIFTEVGGMPRNHLAAVGATTGVVTAWNPGSDGYVQDLELHGTSVFVGGTFGMIGGQARSNLAQIDLASGLATAWNPQANNEVLDVEVLSPGGVDRVYAGGRFTAMGPLTRHHFAELDISTGQPTASDPSPSGWVYALSGNDTVLYIGGVFSEVGGLPRDNLAEIDLSLGEPTSFVCGTDDLVTALLLDGDQLYVGGEFRTLCGAPRNCAGRIVVASGGVDSWDPDAAQWVDVFAPGVAGEIYVGGVFFGINGRTRNYLASFDMVTKEVTPWNPDPDWITNALDTDGTQLFVGGEFDSVGATPRPRLASFDLGTGALTAWNPTSDGGVVVMSVLASSVYVGGWFQQAGGAARSGLAAIGIDGILLPWNPGPDASVEEIEATPGGIYVGGHFNQIGGQTRNHIARIDASTGLADAWNPNASAVVRGITFGESTVYVCGDFSTMGGAARVGAAELDPVTGQATSWDAAIPGGLGTTIEVYQDKLWLGGVFEFVQGQPHKGLAAFRLPAQTLLAWDPVPSSATTVAILDDGSNVFFGGGFASFGGAMTYGMAKTDASALAAPIPGITGAGGSALTVSPNPLRGAGTLHFDLRREGDVRIDLFDVRGRRVRTLLDGVRMPAGRHAVGLPADGLVPGVYFARWEGAGERGSVKVTVIR